MGRHTLTGRQYLILGLVALCAPLGDTCLSRGMTAMPAISIAHPASLVAAVFTPWIALGIALLIGFFASYLTALSWADLTFVLPATAFGNVIVALLARVWLHEQISLARWSGIALITLGVSFVAQGPSRTERPGEPVKEPEHIDPDVKEPPAKRPEIDEPPAKQPDVKEPGISEPGPTSPEPKEVGA
jgi:drug/metabolite transporter (DMT)-like permease